MNKHTLRSRIFLPLVALLILLAPLVDLAFSAIISQYSMNLSRNAITSTLELVRDIVDRIYVEPGDAALETDAEREAQARDFLYETRRALRRHQFESQIIVLDRQFTPLYPQGLDPDTDAIIGFFRLNTDHYVQTGSRRFERIDADGQEYLASIIQLTDPEAVLTNYLIVYSSISDTGSLMRASVFIVLLLTMILVLASLAVSWFAATSVAKPIGELSGHMAAIGAGDFRPTDQVSNVIEIDALITSTNQMSQRLSRYDQAQRVFFQNASHELRTPLMSIQGYAEGIELGILEDTKQAAGVIAEESRQLTRLVDGLLTLSRLDNDQQPLDIEHIALKPFIANLLERVNGLAIIRDVTLSLDIGDAVMIAADEQLLTLTVMNVLSNAIRYARTTVRVTCDTTRETAALTIENDGAPIEPDNLPRVFDRFFKGKDGCFGIGLSVAKSSMEYMKGSIIALPRSDGAAFQLTLPRAGGADRA